MPNRHCGTLNKNVKYGVHYNDPEYTKTKNKVYYSESIKNNPDRAKSSLISYYKRKYGEELVLNVIQSYGVSLGIDELKKLKKPKIKPSIDEILMIDCY